MMFVLAAVVPLSAAACPRHRRSSYASRSYRSRSARSYTPRYATRGYSYQQPPSFYRRHRNLINLGVATGGGALIGALLGGKRGSLIGTAIGAGSGAIYTYGINKKKRRY